ncbi:DUF222 domain-containing protein [Gordonia sp. (in: high G+C Gram-positive bacteria)]|uniref:HNH endonuclease signature motif containing protein n=1 Tax=Gordonia sp. (in: high G+C Gram-positive bacteria) TaxID=84139 RepID=UPI003341FF75
MSVTLEGQAGATVAVEDGDIVVRIVMPAVSDGDDADDAALLLFATRADSFQGFMMWERYAAAHKLWQRKVESVSTALDDQGTPLADRGVSLDEQGEYDVFTRVYDPLCQTAASYATVAGVKQFTAELFIDRAISCMERVPAVGSLMRDGVLIPLWFHAALEQTEAVTDEHILAVIDAEAALALREAGHLSKTRVIEIVQAIVAEHDPEAARVARETAKVGKRVVVEPVDADLAELKVTASVEDTTLALNSINSVMAGACSKDPRTTQERRSAAAIALLTGALFACECDDPECEARGGVDAAAQCAKVVLHAIVRRESLTGESDTPAYLDGHGPISAEHARDIAARSDTTVRDLDLGELLDRTSQPSDGYRPTAACAVAVRAVHGRCTHPGCDMPAWKCDLDHVVEYDHDNPAAGGATCPCNLNPKCRFHHGLKTHVAGWVDDQIVDANGVIWTEVTTPEGVTVRSRALNGWLLPELGLLPCRHDDAAGSVRPEAEPEPQRRLTRAAAKHRYRMRIRAANRRNGVVRHAAVVAAGEPPF